MAYETNVKMNKGKKKQREKKKRKSASTVKQTVFGSSQIISYLFIETADYLHQHQQQHRYYQIQFVNVYSVP